MDSVAACCQSPPAPLMRVPDEKAFQSALIEATSIAGEQSTDIKIQTADGDTVTLSSDMAFEVATVTYQELSRTNASFSESQGQFLSASATHSLELTVEGHLDQQEKKEVKMVLASLFKMIKDFVTGKKALHEIPSLTDLGSIAEVSAQVDISARLTVAAQASAHYAGQTPLAAKSAVQPAPASVRPAVSDRIDKLTDRMIGIIKESGVAPSTVYNRFNRQISKGSGQFMNAKPAAWQRMQLKRKILENFIGKLREWTAENKAEDPVQSQAGAEKAALPAYFASLETSAVFSQIALSAARQEIHIALEYSKADQYQP